METDLPQFRYIVVPEKQHLNSMDSSLSGIDIMLDLSFLAVVGVFGQNQVYLS